MFHTLRIHFSTTAVLVAQKLKPLPAMWETWVQSLGLADPLEKEMATHSSILALRIPWTEEPGGLQSTGSQRVGHTEEYVLNDSLVTEIYFHNLILLSSVASVVSNSQLFASAQTIAG